jgi:hypothetical protein
MALRERVCLRDEVHLAIIRHLVAEGTIVLDQRPYQVSINHEGGCVTNAWPAFCNCDPVAVTQEVSEAQEAELRANPNTEQWDLVGSIRPVPEDTEDGSQGEEDADAS